MANRDNALDPSEQVEAPCTDVSSLPCKPTTTDQGPQYSDAASNCHSLTPELLDTHSEYLDISEEFRYACQELDLGEMVHVDKFTLLDAMSAIELSEKKQEETSASSEDICINQDMPVTEVLAVLDQLLCCVGTWLQGNTLLQTVFSFSLASCTDRIENVYIRSFTRMLVKLMFYFKETVRQAGVQEEEDAMDMCLDSSFLENMSIAEIQKELEGSIETFCKLKNIPTPRPMSEQEGGDISEDESLVLRLRLILVLFTVAYQLDRFPDLRQVEMAQTLLKDNLKLLDLVINSHICATEVSDWRRYGFQSTDLTLLPPNPRKTAILPFLESTGILRAAFEDLLSVIAIVAGADSFRPIFVSFSSFSKDPTDKCRPNILARSYFKLMIYYNKKLLGNYDFEVCLRDELKYFCNPPSLSSSSKISSKIQVRKLVSQFLSRVQGALVEIMHYLCMSRARQFQILQQNLFITLSQLLSEADGFDCQMHKIGEQVAPPESHIGYFVSWVLYHILQIMTDYLQLGFEYDLYSLFEFHYIFWYLEYLMGCKQSCLEMSQNLLTVTTEPTLKKGKGSSHKKRNRKDFNFRIQVFEGEKIYLNSLRLLCIGYLRAMEALTLANKVKIPSFDFGKREFCFEQRFFPFSHLSTPKPLLYEKYAANSNIEQLNPKDRDKMFQSSAKHFQVAKTSLEKYEGSFTSEIEKVLKVTKMNIVTMNLAASGHKMNTPDPPEFDFSLSKNFPIIRLK